MSRSHTLVAVLTFACLLRLLGLENIHCTTLAPTAGEGYSICPAVAGTYALAQPKFQQSQLVRAKTVSGCPQHRFQLLGLFLVSPGDWRGGDHGPPHHSSKHNAGQKLSHSRVSAAMQHSSEDQALERA